MKKITIENHKQMLPYYGTLIADIILSFFYSDVTTTRVLIGLALLLIATLAVGVGKNQGLIYITLALVVLSMSNVRDKYNTTLTEKLEKRKYELREGLRPEKEFVGQPCGVIKDDEKKSICMANNAYNQKKHDEGLKTVKADNKKIHNQILTANVELTFLDELPIYLYVCLSGVMIFMSGAFIKPSKIEQVEEKEVSKIEYSRSELIDRVRKIKKDKKNITRKLELLSNESGISLSTLDRWYKASERNVTENDRKVIDISSRKINA